jgi:hypothetical protein
MLRAWVLPALLVLALPPVAACDTRAEFPVPSGPPQVVVLDVRLPVDLLGSWVVSAFSDTLRRELARYNIQTTELPPAPKPEHVNGWQDPAEAQEQAEASRQDELKYLRDRHLTIARIDLGHFTYRTRESAEFYLVSADGSAQVGQIHFVGLDLSTLDEVAIVGAPLLARALWATRLP